MSCEDKLRNEIINMLFDSVRKKGEKEYAVKFGHLKINLLTKLIRQYYIELLPKKYTYEQIGSVGKEMALGYTSFNEAIDQIKKEY